MRQPFDNTIWVLGGGRTAPNPSAAGGRLQPGDQHLDHGAVDAHAPAATSPRTSTPAGDGRIWAAGGYDVDDRAAQHCNEQFTCTVPVDLMTFDVE